MNIRKDQVFGVALLVTFIVLLFVTAQVEREHKAQRAATYAAYYEQFMTACVNDDTPARCEWMYRTMRPSELHP